MDRLSPVTLNGTNVRLEPLTEIHLEPLCSVGLEPSIWSWNPSPIQNRDDMRRYIESALNAQQKGEMLPFATVDLTSNTVVGSTRYANIDMANKRLEIGWTWIAPYWQRTAINTEAKLLMLRHAFNTLQCNRVEWKTDSLNERSRNAILRLGAQFEGTLRQHMVTASGRLRDTVYYSVVHEEWPSVEKGLLLKLSSRTK